MKKTIIIGLMLLASLSIFAQIPAGYVDLGLPSGTLWKDANENGFYQYDEAVKRFGKQLPRKSQMEELVNQCQWRWTGDGYIVFGPNGNTLFMPTDGYEGCDDHELYDGGLCGFYWSIAQRDTRSAWIIDLYDPHVEFATLARRDHVSVTTYDKCRGISVRLVK